MSNIITPSKLKELCTEFNLKPSKSYGQHYLISDVPIKKMIEAGELTKDDTIIEIGPGFGVLTLALAPLVKKVIAFEIEQRLKPYWGEKQKEYPNIDIIWGNALNEFISYNLSPVTPYKVLANLPYQITSDAIRMLLETVPAPEKIIFMVQKEVAERICAKPPDMSMLSVAVQYYGKAKIVAKVPAGAFWPAPKVDSAVIMITPEHPSTRAPEHSSTQAPEHLGTREHDEQFFRVVRAGFSQKRKQLWHNLSGGLQIPAEKVKSGLKEVCGNEKVRAEELSVEEWRYIVRDLHSNIVT
ncbi:MAG: ribosomal RNA small subunit methyltransferase A [Candidatus Magasanikbacteria bacterium]|nr:ribosomal RNA small subunit methyltransferase A [Candidatus Magasanikbacteria bacterium]